MTGPARRLPASVQEFPLAPPAIALRSSDRQWDLPSPAEKTPFSGLSLATPRSGHDQRSTPSLPACSRPGQRDTCCSNP